MAVIEGGLPGDTAGAAKDLILSVVRGNSVIVVALWLCVDVAGRFSARTLSVSRSAGQPVS
jgi:hypothetical protein